MPSKGLTNTPAYKSWEEFAKKELDRVVEVLKPDVEFEEVGLSDWFGRNTDIVPLLASRELVEQGKQLPDEIIEAMNLEHLFIPEHLLLGLSEGKTNLSCVTVNNNFSPTLYAEIEKVMKKKHPCKVVLLDHLGAVV